MALARVQGSAKGTSSNTLTVTVTLATGPVVGNALLVLMNVWGGAVTFTTCTDSAGNAYTLAVTKKTGVATIGVWLCATLTATATPLTLTLTGSALGYWVGTAVEVSGVGTGLVVDQHVEGTGFNLPVGTGPCPALTADAVVEVAMHGIASAQSAIVVDSATPVWGVEFEELPLTYLAGEANLRVVTGARGTTPSCSWTESTAGNWSSLLVALRAGTPVLAGEIDRRTLTTATGTLNATWTGTAAGNWVAGLVALKKT